MSRLVMPSCGQSTLSRLVSARRRPATSQCALPCSVRSRTSASSISPESLPPLRCSWALLPELWPHPCGRLAGPWRGIDGRRVAAQRFELPPQVAQQPLGETGAHLTAVAQLPVAQHAEDEGAEVLAAAPLTRGPADDGARLR